MSLAWQHRDRRLCVFAEGARLHAQADRQTEQIALIKPASHPLCACGVRHWPAAANRSKLRTPFAHFG